jgi:hypothetical protein
MPPKKVKKGGHVTPGQLEEKHTVEQLRAKASRMGVTQVDCDGDRLNKHQLAAKLARHVNGK